MWRVVSPWGLWQRRLLRREVSGERSYCRKVINTFRLISCFSSLKSKAFEGLPLLQHSNFEC